MQYGACMFVLIVLASVIVKSKGSQPQKKLLKVINPPSANYTDIIWSPNYYAVDINITTAIDVPLVKRHRKLSKEEKSWRRRRRKKKKLQGKRLNKTINHAPKEKTAILSKSKTSKIYNKVIAKRPGQKAHRRRKHRKNKPYIKKIKSFVVVNKNISADFRHSSSTNALVQQIFVEAISPHSSTIDVTTREITEDISTTTSIYNVKIENAGHFTAANDVKNTTEDDEVAAEIPVVANVFPAFKINYSNLLKPSTPIVVPPIPKENITLNTLLNELDSIENELNLLHSGKSRTSSSGSDFRKHSPNKTKTRCSANKGGCEHICNANGPQLCSCRVGFYLADNGKNCIDLNECQDRNGECEYDCKNTPGSYYCECPEGLRLSDDHKSCHDINECLLRNGHGPCQDTCTNTEGSYICSCASLPGTLLSSDMHTCEDIDECREGRSGCSHGCVNTMGRSFCTCPEGFDLDSDWKTCKDINECDVEDIRRHCELGCVNTIGSFYCLVHNILNDETYSPNIANDTTCSPIFPPDNGYIKCIRDKILGPPIKTRHGRVRVTNRPGTFCELVCPSGYNLFGEFKLTCGIDGKWVGPNYGTCKHNPTPTISCPKSQTFFIKENEKTVNVNWNSPKTNLPWEYVRGYPYWAKNLRYSLPVGDHWIKFVAEDPVTFQTAKCSFKISIQ